MFSVADVSLTRKLSIQLSIRDKNLGKVLLTSRTVCAQAATKVMSIGIHFERDTRTIKQLPPAFDAFKSSKAPIL